MHVLASLLVVLPHAASAAVTGDLPPTGGAEAYGEQEDRLRLEPPVLVHFQEAPYPAGIDQGEVEVRLHLLVGEHGLVEEVEAVEGPEPFLSLARWAAERFRFSPAREGGKPAKVEIPFTYVFAAPPVNVEGQVRCRTTGAPLEGVTVLVGARAATTDGDGYFTMRNVAPGEFTPRLGGDGWSLGARRFALAPGEVLQLDLQASRDGEEPELVGTWRKGRQPVVRRSLTTEEVRAVPGTFGDPVRAVQNLPGMGRSPLDAGWLLVRGGRPGDTGLYLDGVRVPLVYHLLGMTSVIHPQMVKRVDLEPGAHDARYGRATAGAVNLVTRRADEGEDTAHVHVDLISAGAFARRSLGGGGGIAAAVRHSYLDTVLNGLGSAGLFGLSEGSGDIAPRYWDWQAMWDREGAGVMGFGYQDSLRADRADGDGTVDLDLGTTRIHGRLELPVGEQALTFTPVLGLDTHHLAYPGYVEERRERQVGGRLEVSDSGRGDVGMSAGLDVEAGHYGIALERDESPGIQTREASFISPDPYLDVRLGEERRLVMGFRLETLLVEGQLPRLMPSPGLHGLIPLGSAELFGGLRISHQWPPMEYLVGYLEGPYLRLERATGGDAGIRWGAGPMEAEHIVFARALQDVTLVEDDGTLGQGSGRAYGVENMVRFSGEGWWGWAAYTWSRTMRRQEPGRPLLPDLYDQPHVLTLVAARQLAGGWSLSSRFRATSGFPSRDAPTSAYDLLLQERRCVADGTPTTDGTGCQDLEGRRLSPFHSLDVRLARTMTWRYGTWEAWLDLQNSYNRRSAEPVITGNILMESSWSWGLPLLPVIGVHGTFNRPGGA